MVSWIGQKTVRKIAETCESGHRLVTYCQFKARWGKRDVPETGVLVVFHYEPDASQTEKRE
jgi:hypothetical protein